VRRKDVAVVARNLVDEAQTVIERQLVRHLPVVLNLEVVVPSNEARHQETRRLRVARERPGGGIRKRELLVERVAGGRREHDRRLEVARGLLLQAVLEE